jgi:hypothetical protein
LSGVSSLLGAINLGLGLLPLTLIYLFLLNFFYTANNQSESKHAKQDLEYESYIESEDNDSSDPEPENPEEPEEPEKPKEFEEAKTEMKHPKKNSNKKDLD